MRLHLSCARLQRWPRDPTQVSTASADNRRTPTEAAQLAAAACASSVTQRGEGAEKLTFHRAADSLWREYQETAFYAGSIANSGSTPALSKNLAPGCQTLGSVFVDRIITPGKAPRATSSERSK